MHVTSVALAESGATPIEMLAVIWVWVSQVWKLVGRGLSELHRGARANGGAPPDMNIKNLNVTQLFGLQNEYTFVGSLVRPLSRLNLFIDSCGLLLCQRSGTFVFGHGYRDCLAAAIGDHTS